MVKLQIDKRYDGKRREDRGWHNGWRGAFYEFHAKNSMRRYVIGYQIYLEIRNTYNVPSRYDTAAKAMLNGPRPIGWSRVTCTPLGIHSTATQLVHVCLFVHGWFDRVGTKGLFYPFSRKCNRARECILLGIERRTVE